MPKELLGRIKESVTSIGPFFILILVLHFSGIFMVGANNVANVFQPNFYGTHYVQLESLFNPSLVVFLIAFPLMVVGMSLFGMGADQAMEKMGSAVGASLTKKRSIVLLAIVSVLIGTLVTFAEPDLTIFSAQLLGEDNKYVLIIIISIGVGLLLAVAFVRVLLQWDYRIILMFLFAVVFGLGCLINRDSFFPIVLDSSGVTIGSVTVPFVLAMGISVAQIRGSKNAEDDSFGLTGLAGLGPLVTCMIWAKVMDEKIVSNDGFGQAFKALVSSTDAYAFGPSQWGDMLPIYRSEAAGSALDTVLGMAPLIVMFALYDFCFLHLDWKKRLKIAIGLAVTYVGLFTFMLGVNTGFMSTARQLGRLLGSQEFRSHFYVVALLALLIGTLIILAEPSVHILGKQVEEVSQGSIRVKDLYLTLCIGVGSSVLVSVLRVQYDIPIMYFAVPLMFLSMILALVSPKIFTGLAFDSAGIASSTMASAFLMPMVVAMATAKYGAADAASVISYGTGVVGMVYLCPLISIQSLGLIGRFKSIVAIRINRRRIVEADDSQIIHIPGGEPVRDSSRGGE